MPPVRAPFLHQISRAEHSFLARTLREETVGGALLLLAAAVAVAWASSPWAPAYEALRGTRFGPATLGLNLDVASWAADGLLAVFFFVAGLELKRELVVGELRNPRDAALPVAAALAGMAVPALVYLLVTRGDPSALRGWAVPMATDIAFALAVLGLLGSALPTALRAFLLTLAVVDDLGAIVVIAVFYTSSLRLLPLLGATALLAAYAVLQRRRVRTAWVYLPLAAAVWVLVHDSGVHATVAGVALGLLTRVRPDPGEERSPAERLEHRVRPVSAGVCVPVFALTASGVALGGAGLRGALGDVAALGVVAGLVVGKALGVFGGAYLTARLTRARLNPDLAWSDVFGVAVLAGVGFTVSLLLAELAFGADPTRVEHVTTAVLAGSTLAGSLAAVVLRTRHHRYRRLAAQEQPAPGQPAPGQPAPEQPARGQQGRDPTGDRP